MLDPSLAWSGLFRGVDERRGRTAERPRILYFSPQTCRTVSRTGIQRVAVQVAKALLPVADLDFVKWDPLDGQLRYFNRFDLETFFQSRTLPAGVSVSRQAELRRYRFLDTLRAPASAGVWLFAPEVPYHEPGGALVFQCLLAQMREAGVRTATVFYDLIPITNADYRSHGESPHCRYVRESLGVDLVAPISLHVGEELARYEAQVLGVDAQRRAELRHVIAPVPLGTINSGVDAALRAAPRTGREDVVLLLGTVEPRKRQVEVLRAFQARRLGPKHGLRLVVIGSLHPLVVDAFNALLRDDPHVSYLGYANDAEVRELFARSRFSVFASNDEGFGLPISESLAHGVPCLAANFGSMREVGEGGGCLLVDVNSEAALGDALELLAGDDELVAELRRQIGERRFWTWDDYASELVAQMARHPGLVPPAASPLSQAWRDAGRRPGAVNTFDVEGETWRLVWTGDLDGRGAEMVADSLIAEGGGPAAVVFGGRLVAPAAWSQRALEALAGVDVWAFAAREDFEALVAACGVRDVATMLPTRCAFSAPEGLADAAAAEVLRLARDRGARRLAARRELALRSAPDARGGLPATGVVLSLMISTYNRAPFVRENVRWLLSQLRSFQGRIHLTVVDNASTDDTEQRLAEFIGDSNFTYVRNTVNVGMIGSWNVCSTHLVARHTWVVGDDDFITPGTLAAVLQALDEDPYLSFIIPNFGVYHREALGPGDSAGTLIRDPVVLAPQPSPTGLYPVRRIAREHDNLYTAIYAIVFRTDLFSACFNYPFTGQPFASLTESIPTTRMILETYGDTEALWMAEVGIVGNAHNSWRRYRVPWHGVLMPLAFDLAREAGVDPCVLQRWAKLQQQLYTEAEGLFPDYDLAENFDAHDLDTSLRVFRRRLQPPTGSETGQPVRP